MNTFKYPSKATIEKLTSKLNIKNSDSSMQDWEYEVADMNHLGQYIDCYNQCELSDNEKFTLMRVILEAYNDFKYYSKQTDAYEIRIKKILLKDFSIHKETLIDWSCEGEDSEDCFAITAFIREILESN